MTAGAAIGRLRRTMHHSSGELAAALSRLLTDTPSCGIADAELEHAFRRDAQLRAADVAPFLRRTRRLKLEALAR